MLQFPSAFDVVQLSPEDGFLFENLASIYVLELLPNSLRRRLIDDIVNEVAERGYNFELNNHLLD